MTTATLGSGLSPKTKSTSTSPAMEEVRIPIWITSAEAFQGSALSEILSIPEGSGYGYFMRPADPFGTSTSSVNRLLTDVVRSWMDENLTDPAALNPADYLFEQSEAEPVPSAWLEALFAMPVHEDITLVMNPDDE